MDCSMVYRILTQLEPSSAVTTRAIVMSLGSSTALDLWRRGDNDFLNMLSLGIGQDTMQGTRTPRKMASFIC